MIAVVSIGPLKLWLVEGVVEFVNDYYSHLGISAGFGRELQARLFSVAFNPSRKQYLGRVFLPTLLNLKERLGARAVLGITGLDLYEKGLNFVFGLASSSLRSAIISIYRLRNEFYGLEPNENLLLERVVKEVMHELGHVFDLPHCPNNGCVMHFSTSILDTNLKDSIYCSRCEEKLIKNLEVPL